MYVNLIIPVFFLISITIVIRSLLQSYYINGTFLWIKWIKSWNFIFSKTYKNTPLIDSLQTLINPTFSELFLKVEIIGMSEKMSFSAKIKSG